MPRRAERGNRQHRLSRCELLASGVPPLSAPVAGCGRDTRPAPKPPASVPSGACACLHISTIQLRNVDVSNPTPKRGRQQRNSISVRSASSGAAASCLRARRAPPPHPPPPPRAPGGQRPPPPRPRGPTRAAARRGARSGPWRRTCGKVGWGGVWHAGESMGALGRVRRPALHLRAATPAGPQGAAAAAGRGRLPASLQRRLQPAGLQRSCLGRARTRAALPAAAHQ